MAKSYLQIISKYKRLGLFSLTLITLFSLLVCSSSPPFSVTIRELSACKGWDKARKPIGISKTFSPEEKRIYACGRLETNNPPITITIDWFYEGKHISSQVVADVTDYFYSPIEPEGQTFSEGSYEIKVYVGNRLVHQVGFRIEQS